jgi:flavin reductase (DIM6/NTAB) family NADH-FMN oxidoreductase RutF
MKVFKEIKPEQLTDNVFRLVGSDWMLVTAGTSGDFNTMTASWGGFGVLWHKKICFCTIRPQRYTYGFMERSDYFTLSFFEKQYRETLLFMGTHSGRDVDKIAETGLTPLESSYGSVYFEEARLVIECRKIYYHDLVPENFLDEKIHDNYPGKDYHRLYIGEIVNCLVR